MSCLAVSVAASSCSVLDDTFGTNPDEPGVVRTDAVGYHNNVVVQFDDRIVALGVKAGHLPDGGVSESGLAGFETNGAEDESFELTGFEDVSFPSEFWSAVTQPDGTILALGNDFEYGNGVDDVVVARFSAEGVLDTSFGDNGLATVFVDDSKASGETIVLVDRFSESSDIIVAGRRTFNGDLAPYNVGYVARLHADGTLDASFGDGGVQVVDFDPSMEKSQSLNDVAVDADGNIVAFGYARKTLVGDGPDPALMVVRLTAAGAYDTTFGSNGGIVAVPREGNTSWRVYGELTGAGDILVATSDTDGTMLVRLTDAGVPDAGFGVNGVVLDTQRSASVGGLLLVGEKFVVVGTGSKRNTTRPHVTRYFMDGSWDESLGEFGTAEIEVDDVFGVRGALQSDGKIIVSARLDDNSLMLARIAM